MIVKKTKNKTLRQQYETILNEKNKTLKDCKMLSFHFNSIAESHAFHFKLMDNHVPYYIYDGPENNATVITDDDQTNIIKEIAAQFNAEKHIPKID